MQMEILVRSSNDEQMQRTVRPTDRICYVSSQLSPILSHSHSLAHSLSLILTDARIMIDQ